MRHCNFFLPLLSSQEQGLGGLGPLFAASDLHRLHPSILPHLCLWLHPRLPSTLGLSCWQKQTFRLMLWLRTGKPRQRPSAWVARIAACNKMDDLGYHHRQQELLTIRVPGTATFAQPLRCSLTEAVSQPFFSIFCSTRGLLNSRYLKNYF